MAMDPQQEEALRKRLRAKRKEKRAAKRGDDDGGLNLNSMMDMMTIILVFLLKSYGEEPLSINGNTDVPFSTSELKPKDMTTITISREAIFVNDERAVELTGQIVDKKDKASSGSLVILPLENKLKKVVEVQRKYGSKDDKAKFKGEITIISDASTPYRTITEVLQTAMLSEFRDFRFAVVKGGKIYLSGTIPKKPEEGE